MPMAVVYSVGAFLLLLAATSAQYCPNPLHYEGNFYCSEVEAITYTNVGGSGFYNVVTDMDSITGQCSSTPLGYSGSLSPLNEEVSLHVRGPLRLLKFAAYTPVEASVRKVNRDTEIKWRRHVHQHAHNMQKRQVGAEVTATIDGMVETWINEYSGSPATVRGYASPTQNVTSASASTQSSNASLEPATTNTWGRQGFYDVKHEIAEGIVFLNHFGGTGSGVFDYAFGNSLSYASCNATTGVSSPRILADTVLSSGTEVVIMSDTECGDNNGGCGYYRPGTVAYHGFDGAGKAFFFEFEMPNDGRTTTNLYDPVNMPSIWMLNAQIPRTLQYGNPNCSCWQSGCGEFDIFEVLTPGYNKAKSTLHGNIAGGSSDWFARPESRPMKFGVVMFDDNIHVKILDDATNFGSEQAANVIQDIIESTMTPSATVSLFSLDGTGSG